MAAPVDYTFEDIDDVDDTTERLWSEADRESTPEGCWPWCGTVGNHGYGVLYVHLCGCRILMRAHRLAYLLHHKALPVPPRLVTHACGNRLCINPRHLEDGDHISNAADRERHGRTAHGERNGAYTHPERVPRGERSGARRHPERVSRGDGHYARTTPEKLARGDRHGSKTHPERLKRGDEHPARLHPERVARGEKAGGATLTEALVYEVLRLAAQGVSHERIAAIVGVARTTVGAILRGETWGHVTGLEPSHPGPLRGDQLPQTKLTKALVHEIHRLRALGYSQRKIAAIVGVSQGTVWKALSDERWTHVSPSIAE